LRHFARDSASFSKSKYFTIIPDSANSKLQAVGTAQSFCRRWTGALAQYR
jgi:hypothetical protein